MTEPKFGYKNYADLTRCPRITQELIDHAMTTYDKWTKCLLKHPKCPGIITEKYALSPVWYERVAAVLPRNKYTKFKHLLKDDKDRRVQKYLKRAETTGWRLE